MTATIAIALTLAATAQAAPQTSNQQARQEIRRLWGSSAPRVFCIIDRESNWNPRAISRTNDHGLMQLNAPTWRRHFGVRWNRVYDPVANVRMGYQVFVRQGWAAWYGGRWNCR